MNFFVEIYRQFAKNFSYSREYNIKKEKLMGAQEHLGHAIMNTDMQFVAIR